MTAGNTRARIAYVDMDGTILNSQARFDLARARGEGKIHWPTAFTPRLLELDVPLPEIPGILNRMEEEGWKIIYLTSRPDRKALRAATLRWLQKHGFWNERRVLLMKPLQLRFMKTNSWKAGVISNTAADEILFIDDDIPNREAVTALALAHVTCKEAF